MSWARFDDEAGDHPKVAMVSDEAGWLWFRAILWSRKHKTSGFVPSGALRGLTKARRPNVLAKELVNAIPPGFKVGLFEPHEHGFVIHDFEEFGPPAREDPEGTVTAPSSRSAAAKKAAEARWSTKRDASPTHAESHPNASADASTSHPPTHADASPTHAESHPQNAIPSRARADTPASAPASPDPDPVEDTLSAPHESHRAKTAGPSADRIAVVLDELEVGLDLWPPRNVAADALSACATRIARVLDREQVEDEVSVRDAVSYARSYLGRFPSASPAQLLAETERKVGYILKDDRPARRVERDRRRADAVRPADDGRTLEEREAARAAEAERRRKADKRTPEQRRAEQDAYEEQQRREAQGAA